ncbi:MAG: ATP-dependent helicase [Thermoleophilia bacterium]
MSAVKQPPDQTPPLIWTTTISRPRNLRALGYKVLRFRTVRRRYIVRAQTTASLRSSLELPAQKLFTLFEQRRRVAVRGVRLESIVDLHDLFAYVIEPALRRGCELLIEADRPLAELHPSDFIDEAFGYAWTLERLHWLAEHPPPGRGHSSPTTESAEPAWLTRLDEPQRRAVLSHHGVTQVIAPAGSGKTLVLVSRVRELLQRGAAPEAILCLTFNAKAKDELQQRLKGAGTASIEARTFHSVGRMILQAEGQGRPLAKPPSLRQWRRLAKTARDSLGERGTWVEADEAGAAVTGYKLGAMITPAEAERQAEAAWRVAIEAVDAKRREGGRHGREVPAGTRHPVDRSTSAAALAAVTASALAVTTARIYALYQHQLEETGKQDFDDMIVRSVRLLRADADVRARWQQRWQYLLVDEYQDIEPAQEMLVRLLAAPQDCLFCVGDEDQTLYAWRRASIETMLAFDLAYPGLQRIALARCYRCPEAIVSCARRLVEHNRYRFPKAIKAVAAAPAAGTSCRAGTGGGDRITVIAAESLLHGAALVAEQLGGSEPSEVAVVARTSRLLRLVAAECVAQGIRFQGSAQILPAGEAHALLSAYLRVLTNRRAASGADVGAVLRAPNHHLPVAAQTAIAQRLRQGATFAEAVAGLSHDALHFSALDEAAVFLDDLSDPGGDASEILWRLRSEGGLDQQIVNQESLSATEQIEVETLMAAQHASEGSTLAEFAAKWTAQDHLVDAGLTTGDGVELTTVHGAKGREWPTVYLFGADEHQLPHASSANDIEAERRIAYVAFTRARERLVIVYTAGQQSRFLVEAGLVAPAPG